MSTKPLGEILVEQRLLTREQLQVALEIQSESGKPLGRVLIEMGAVAEDALVEAVARRIGVPYADLAGKRLDPDLVALLPEDLARRLPAVPVALDGANMVVAMAEPTNVAAIRQMQSATGFQIHPALAVRRLIVQALDDAKARVPSLEDEVLREAAAAHAPASEEKEIRIHDLLERVIDEGASDLHLAAGAAPTIRVRGGLQALADYPLLLPAEVRRLVYSILTQRQREKLETNLELDLAYTLPGKARFRVNVYFQKDAMGAAFRLIPVEVRSIEQLGLPPKVAEFARLTRGFVLVTGPTGHGKSTTLAAMVDVVNRERSEHIMTVEDPIEYLHNHKTGIINQREVGTDTQSFASALKHVLRQDPDVILVGEMRDLETIQTALTAAETGHLVFATLHTQDAPQTIDRVVDVFPPHQQQQVRVQLAASIQGIVTQQLLPAKDGNGRAVACEILVATPAIRNMIREGKTHMIYSAMQAGGKFGMQTMDQALAELVKKGTIGYELGLERSHNAEDFNKLCGRS